MMPVSCAAQVLRCTSCKELHVMSPWRANDMAAHTAAETRGSRLSKVRASLARRFASSLSAEPVTQRRLDPCEVQWRVQDPRSAAMLPDLCACGRQGRCLCQCPVCGSAKGGRRRTCMLHARRSSCRHAAKAMDASQPRLAATFKTRRSERRLDCSRRDTGLIARIRQGL